MAEVKVKDVLEVEFCGVAYQLDRWKVGSVLVALGCFVGEDFDGCSDARMLELLDEYGLMDEWFLGNVNRL